MNKLHLGAVALSIFAATAAVSEDIQATILESENGSVILTGVLRAADADTYTLETAVGLLTVKRASSVCKGFCPTEAMTNLPVADSEAEIGKDS